MESKFDCGTGNLSKLNFLNEVLINWHGKFSMENQILEPAKKVLTEIEIHKVPNNVYRSTHPGVRCITRQGYFIRSKRKGII